MLISKKKKTPPENRNTKEKQFKKENPSKDFPIHRYEIRSVKSDLKRTTCFLRSPGWIVVVQVHLDDTSHSNKKSKPRRLLRCRLIREQHAIQESPEAQRPPLPGLLLLLTIGSIVMSNDTTHRTSLSNRNMLALSLFQTGDHGAVRSHQAKHRFHENRLHVIRQEHSH